MQGTRTDTPECDCDVTFHASHGPGVRCVAVRVCGRNLRCAVCGFGVWVFCTQQVQT